MVDGHQRFAVTSSLPDGGPDPAFGGGTGKVTTQVGSSDNAQASAVLVQPDARIVVVGAARQDNAPRAALVRYIGSTLDNGFGTGGVVLLPALGDGVLTVGRAVLASDGDIVFTGTVRDGATVKVFVARVDSNGTPDAGFGTGGVQRYLVGDGSCATATALSARPDGTFVVFGTACAPKARGLILKAGANGARVSGFGINGEVLEDIAAATLVTGIVDHNGKFVLAGGTIDPNTSASTFHTSIARFAADGSLDTSFGTGADGWTEIADQDVYGALDVDELADGRLWLTADAEVGSNPIQGAWGSALRRHDLRRLPRREQDVRRSALHGRDKLSRHALDVQDRRVGAIRPDHGDHAAPDRPAARRLAARRRRRGAGQSRKRQPAHLDDLAHHLRRRARQHLVGRRRGDRRDRAARVVRHRRADRGIGRGLRQRPGERLQRRRRDGDLEVHERRELRHVRHRRDRAREVEVDRCRRGTGLQRGTPALCFDNDGAPGFGGADKFVLPLSDGALAVGTAGPVDSVRGGSGAARILLVRLNADGTPKTGFGLNGQVQFFRSGADRQVPLAATLVSGGTKLRVATVLGDSSGHGDVQILQFNLADGTLDTTFDGDGLADATSTPSTLFIHSATASRAAATSRSPGTSASRSRRPWAA